MPDVFHTLDTATNPNGLQGFPGNVRGMFVATFILLILYVLLLLIKYFVNLIAPRRSGYAKGGVGSPGNTGWRARQKKSGGRFGQMFATGATPPPPPPPSALKQGPTMEAGQAGMMGAGTGAAAGGPGAGGPDMSDWDHGVESEKGHPGLDNDFSRRLSRGADVARLGFITLLGGAVINAFSFDTQAGNPLSWIYMSLIIIWILLALVTGKRWVPVLMGICAFPILLALYSVAFDISG